jgi:hypothetical protein
MHYVTHRSYRMQKHKFGLTCSDTLFMETAPGPPKQEKYCVDILRPGQSGMRYMTHRFHQIEKHKFGITCPGVLFVKSLHVPDEH